MEYNLLSPTSLKALIARINVAKTNKEGFVSDGGSKYVTKLLQKGVQYMKTIMPKDTGYLRETTDYDEEQGKILVDAYYAAFVEYGTGVVGANQPHEFSGDWQYDTAGYGTSGWTYKNPNTEEFVHTCGQPANAFLLKTAKYLKKLGGNKIKVKVFVNLNTDYVPENGTGTYHYEFHNEYEVK